MLLLKILWQTYSFSIRNKINKNMETIYILLNGKVILITRKYIISRLIKINLKSSNNYQPLNSICVVQYSSGFAIQFLLPWKHFRFFDFQHIRPLLICKPVLERMLKFIVREDGTHH